MHHPVNFDRCQGLARALFEESGQAHLLLHPESLRIVDVNAAAQRLCGIGVRDLLGAMVSEFVRPAGEEAFSDLRLRGRITRFAYSEFGCKLRTFQLARSIPVDVTVTRLVVKPAPLLLVTIREADATNPRRTLADMRGSELGASPPEQVAVDNCDQTPWPAAKLALSRRDEPG